jgi:trk system potassium uptake protein TrkH
MTLIVSGGIGFIVLHEFRRYLFVRRQPLKTNFSFHSKLAIFITAILISGGALILFFFEMNNVLRHLPVPGKILVPLFQSVSSRTAGFNTVDIGQLTDSSLFFLVILMFIGASPGSCGGGIKTTTAGIVIALLLARFQNRDDVNIGHHRILNDTISKAISVTFFSIVIITMFTITLMVIEKGWVSHQFTRGLFLESLFEVVSAFGTVGLSTGITSGLSSLGKLLIVIVMFIGRVCPLTVVLAIGRKEVPKFRYAPEKVLIG